jgi:phosphoserine phosphatase
VTEILEILPGEMLLNDQGDVVLSLVVVDQEGRRWVGFAVGPSDSIEELAKRAILSALRFRSLHAGQGAPSQEVREVAREAPPPREVLPSSPLDNPEEEDKKKEALRYLRALWTELKRRGVDPAQLTGKASVEDFRELPLEELRKVYKLLHGALK